MKKTLLIIQLILLFSCASFAQSIGIGTNAPDGSSILDITSSTKGLLIPRMSTPSMLNIPSPAR